MVAVVKTPEHYGSIAPPLNGYCTATAAAAAVRSATPHERAAHYVA